MRLELQDASDSSGCIGTSELSKQVESRLGRRVFTAASGELWLSVKLARSTSGWTARLTLSDGAGVLGQRELKSRGKHCSSLDDSLALVIALLVDTPTAPAASEASPVSRTEAKPRAPAAARADTTPSGSGAADSKPTVLFLPSDTPARREPWRLAVGAQFVVMTGALPGLAPGGALTFSAGPPRAPDVRLSIDAYSAGKASVATRDAGARFFLARVGLEVCQELWHGGLGAIEGCAGQRVGRLQVEGYGFDQNSSRTRMLYSLSAALNGSLLLSERLRLVLGAELELPLQRENFVWRSENQVAEALFEQGFAFAALKIGLRWAL